MLTASKQNANHRSQQSKKTCPTLLSVGLPALPMPTPASLHATLPFPSGASVLRLSSCHTVITYSLLPPGLSPLSSCMKRLVPRGPKYGVRFA